MSLTSHLGIVKYKRLQLPLHVSFLSTITPGNF